MSAIAGVISDIHFPEYPFPVLETGAAACRWLRPLRWPAQAAEHPYHLPSISASKVWSILSPTTALVPGLTHFLAQQQQHHLSLATPRHIHQMNTRNARNATPIHVRMRMVLSLVRHSCQLSHRFIRAVTSFALPSVLRSRLANELM